MNFYEFHPQGWRAKDLALDTSFPLRYAENENLVLDGSGHYQQTSVSWLTNSETGDSR